MDVILQRFIDSQAQDLADLHARSDVVNVRPIAANERIVGFLVALHCAHMVQQGSLVLERTDWCEFAIQLPEDYLQHDHSDSSRILTFLAPAALHHPNVAFPFVCVGPVAASTPLRQLILRVYEILTYNRFHPHEYDCLNQHACQWARANVSRFPLERRALVRTAPEGSGAAESEA